jgi:hypothetical protein
MDPEAEKSRCQYFESLFSPYIDGTLDEVERKALAEHLHECEACAQRFGLTWREVTNKVAGDPATRRLRGVRRRSSGIWVLAIFCLAGVTALGAMGLLDNADSGSDLFHRQDRALVGEEIARIIDVQTELLKAVVEPLRGADHHISHATRGEAMDFFQRLQASGSRSVPPGTEPAWTAEFHRLFRAADPCPGGRDWDREEFLGDLAKTGLPRMVLTRVVSGYRSVIFCEVTWGERPAFAWLVRERAEADEPPSEEPRPFRLAFLVLSEP